MKFFRGLLVSKPDDGDEDEQSDGSECECSERAKIAIDVSDGELAGYWKFPEDELEAMKKMDRRVFQQESKYGTGENRTNGFDPNVDSAIFEKCRAKLVKSIEDDSKKPVVRTRLVEEPPGFFRKKSRFKIELQIARIDEEGNHLGWGKVHETEPRSRKADLVPLLADLIGTKVPSVLLSE